MQLKVCPFCGCEMNRVKHSAFHRTDSTLPASCWLATAGEFGGPYELDERDYPAWNRRSPDTRTEALVKAEALLRHAPIFETTHDGVYPRGINTVSVLVEIRAALSLYRKKE